VVLLHGGSVSWTHWVCYIGPLVLLSRQPAELGFSFGLRLCENAVKAISWTSHGLIDGVCGLLDQQGVR
jgi:hypothetical protein